MALYSLLCCSISLSSLAICRSRVKQRQKHLAQTRPTTHLGIPVLVCVAQAVVVCAAESKARGIGLRRRRVALRHTRATPTARRKKAEREWKERVSTVVEIRRSAVSPIAAGLATDINQRRKMVEQSTVKVCDEHEYI